MAVIFTITDGGGIPVASVFVSNDDIAEHRASDPCAARVSDADLAYDVFEMRYESALAKAGYTYDQAVELGFNYTARVES